MNFRHLAWTALLAAAAMTDLVYAQPVASSVPSDKQVSTAEVTSTPQAQSVIASAAEDLALSRLASFRSTQFCSRNMQ